LCSAIDNEQFFSNYPRFSKTAHITKLHRHFQLTYCSLHSLKNVHPCKLYTSDFLHETNNANEGETIVNSHGIILHYNRMKREEGTDKKIGKIL